MDRNQAPPGSSAGSAAGEVYEYQRLKPNAVGMFGVIFMAIATAAPITAMTGNVPVAVGFGNGTGAPAGYIVATVVLPSSRWDTSPWRDTSRRLGRSTGTSPMVSAR